MNKLDGFYELRDLNIPGVPWKEYSSSDQLDENMLYSVRVAVQRGDDTSLPRLIGYLKSSAIKFE